MRKGNVGAGAREENSVSGEEKEYKNSDAAGGFKL